LIQSKTLGDALVSTGRPKFKMHVVPEGCT